MAWYQISRLANGKRNINNRRAVDGYPVDIWRDGQRSARGWRRKQTTGNAAHAHRLRLFRTCIFAYHSRFQNEGMKRRNNESGNRNERRKYQPKKNGVKWRIEMASAIISK
jgi:hypothetical protein